MTTSKERPILFSGPMVRAILKGHKTQTRRLVKPQPRYVQALSEGRFEQSADGGFDQGVIPLECPYGAPGDRLWVRETFFCNSCDYPDRTEHAKENLHYRADGTPDFGGEEKEIRWKPSIHMPRWASRIDLKILSVRTERIGSISDEDARAEGITPSPPTSWIYSSDAVRKFRKLWDSINTKPGSRWSDNPWVWVVEFERVKP